MRVGERWLPRVAGPGGGALRVAQGCVLMLAFVLPFSIALTEGALILGMCALGVSRIRGRRLDFARSWLEPASIALVLSWLLSTVFSVAPMESLYHVRKLYALGLIWLVAECAREPRVRSRLVPLILAGASLTAVVGFVIFSFKVRQDPDYRLQSLLSNQMTSGGVLAASVLWGLAGLAVARGIRRIAYGAVLIPLVAALALTQTRSHWLGVVCGAAVVLLALAPRWWWTLPLSFVVGTKLAPVRLVARLFSIVNPHDPGNQGRLSMWRSGIDIIRDHPWIGVGCQDLLALYRRYRYPDWTFESGHFHNNFVQVTVMTGLIGLVAFLGWHAAALVQLVKSNRVARGQDRGLAAGAAAVFTGLVVAGLFDFTFGDAEVVYHSYLGLGLAIALMPSRHTGNTEGLRSRVAPAN